MRSAGGVVRGLPACQVSSWSIQPSGHNTPSNRRVVGARPSCALYNQLHSDLVYLVTTSMCYMNWSVMCWNVKNLLSTDQNGRQKMLPEPNVIVMGGSTANFYPTLDEYQFCTFRRPHAGQYHDEFWELATLTTDLSLKGIIMQMWLFHVGHRFFGHSF